MAPVKVNAGALNVITLDAPEPVITTFWMLLAPVFTNCRVGRVPAVPALAGVLGVATGGATGFSAVGVDVVTGAVLGVLGVLDTESVPLLPPPHAANEATKTIALKRTKDAALLVVILFFQN